MLWSNYHFLFIEYVATLIGNGGINFYQKL